VRWNKAKSDLGALCKGLKQSGRGAADEGTGIARSAEIRAMTQSLHPPEATWLRKSERDISKRTHDVLTNVLKITQRTEQLLKYATYSEEREWFQDFLERWSSPSFSPWDGLSLPCLEEAIQQANSWDSLQKEGARLINQTADVTKWQKIVQAITKLPFAVDPNGALIPKVHQGLLLMNEVRIYIML
jgi:hypothetical protein